MRVTVLLVMGGGALGVFLRFLLDRGFLAIRQMRSGAGHHTPTYSVGIRIANLVGSFLLGLFAAAFSAGVMSSQAYSLWGVGFCGALTTLSTLNVELVTMLRHHHTWQAVAYLLGTVLGGLALGAIAGLFTFN